MTRRVVRLLPVFGALFMSLISPTACSTIEARARAEDLLVDGSSLPPGWVDLGRSVAHNPNILADQGAAGWASVEFAPPGIEWPYRDTASQMAWDFGSGIRAAVLFYTRFRPDGPTIPTALQGWSYHSAVADRISVYCTKPPPVYRGNARTICHVAAQYGRFITVFWAPIDSECLTIADVERILQAMDSRAAESLGRKHNVTPSSDKAMANIVCVAWPRERRSGLIPVQLNSPGG